jgi:hypothetical protein
MDIVRGVIAVQHAQLLVGPQGDDMRPIHAAPLLDDRRLTRGIKRPVAQTIRDEHDYIC